MRGEGGHHSLAAGDDGVGVVAPDLEAARDPAPADFAALQAHAAGGHLDRAMYEK